MPGPNESQQLTAISDREAELATPKKGLGGYLVPVVGAGVVGAMIILAFVYVLRARAAADEGDAGIEADTEQAILAEAKSKCTVDECEQAHTMVSTFPETSPWRDHADFRYVTSTWAESLLKKARVDPDSANRRATLNRVLADPRVDAMLKKQASDLLATPEPAPAPTDLPTVATTKDSGSAVIAPLPPTPTPARTTPTSHTTVTNATTSAPTATATAPAPKPNTNALDKAREAALRAEPAAVRQLLEQKVRNGHGTSEEANLVRQACKAMGDRACSEDVKAKYP